MKLIVINSSVHKNGNTRVCLDYFVEGFMKSNKNSFKNLHISEIDMSSDVDNIVKEGDVLMVGFPLTVNFLPSDVLELVNTINLYEYKTKVIYFINSGFPEFSHSKPAIEFLKKQTVKAGHEYLGTIVRGGFTGNEWLSPEIIGKLFKSFMLRKIRLCGIHFGKCCTLPDRVLRKVSGSDFLPGIFVYLIKHFGLSYSRLHNKFMDTNAVSRINDVPYRRN